MRKAFTMVELVFTILILGIISAVLLPRYLDISSRGQKNVEEYIIQSVQSGISLYNLKQQL